MFRRKHNEAPPPPPRARIDAIVAAAERMNRRDLPYRPSRTTVYQRAIAMFPDGHRAGVIIKDISSTGVLLEHPQHDALPDRVLILERTTPLRAWADVVWNRGRLSGLRLWRD